MPFNPNPPNPPVFTHLAANLIDWQTADVGKWFIGVVDTHANRVYVVPVNVLEGRGALDIPTLTNTSQQRMNRYASGAAEDKVGPAAPYQTFGPGHHNWLEARPAGVTHHTGVAQHYGANPNDCLGFSIIKLTPGGDFAQMKFASQSLNNGKPGAGFTHNFSLATTRPLPPAPPGMPTPVNAGAAQVPQAWQQALVTYFSGPPFNVTHIAASND
jgi:hypothetical protein